MVATRFWLLVVATAVMGVAVCDCQDYDFHLNLGDVTRLTLNASTVYSFKVTVSIVNGARGVIFQLHSQRNAIALSYADNFSYTKSMHGTDVGLYVNVNFTRDITFYANISCSLFCNGTIEPVDVLAAVTQLVYEHPIPGGCTMTSAVSPDPNLQLNYSSYTTSLVFQNGNVGSGESCYETDFTPTENWKLLQYRVYRQFLKWKDYSVEAMMDALESMLTQEMIDNNTDLVSISVGSTDLKLIEFDTFQGDAVVYNVLLTDVTTSYVSAYVPAISYACTFEVGKPGCQVASSLINKIVSPLMGLVGLFLCLLAHRLFHVEVVVFSWVIMAVPWYMLLVGVFNMSDTVTVSLSLVCSLATAFIIFLLWAFSGVHLPFVFLFSASSGFLAAAILLFTPFGSFIVLKISYVYVLFFLCLMVVSLIPAVLFPRAFNIFSSAFVGSYMIIFAVGAFVITSLSEIMKRVIKCVTISGYLSTDVNYPFELNDIILTCIWVLLLLLGIIVQAGLARGREKFPSSLYKQIKEKFCHWESTKTGERRRLLAGYTDSPRESVEVIYGAVSTNRDISTRSQRKLH